MLFLGGCGGGDGALFDFFFPFFSGLGGGDVSFEVLFRFLDEVEMGGDGGPLSGDSRDDSESEDKSEGDSEYEEDGSLSSK